MVKSGGGGYLAYYMMLGIDPPGPSPDPEPPEPRSFNGSDGVFLDIRLEPLYEKT